MFKSLPTWAGTVIIVLVTIAVARLVKGMLPAAVQPYLP